MQIWGTCKLQMSDISAGRHQKPFYHYQGATYHHLPIRASTVQIIIKKHLPELHFYLPPKEKDLFFVLKVVHNTLLACPIQETVISWSLLQAIGQVLTYVAPCFY